LQTRPAGKFSNSKPDPFLSPFDSFLNRYQRLLKPLLYLAVGVVFVLALTPGEYLTNPIFSVWDKAQHGLTFAALSVLWLMAYSSTPNLFWKGFWVLAVFGALIEVAQYFSGYRNGDPLDWCADMVGVVIVFGAAGWLHLRRQRRPTDSAD